MKNFFVTSISKTDEGYEQLTPHNGGIRIINLQNKQEMIKAFCVIVMIFFTIDLF